MKFNSVLNKNWVAKKYNNLEVQEISEKFSLKEITSRLLAIRNINIENIELFLNPTIKNSMPNPYQLTDMNAAVLRVSKAIENNEVIGIFGDYDVDGASSTAILAKYFNRLKQKVNMYIPDRQKDGYGPNIKAFNHLIKEGSNIIITVDCGTSSHEAIDFAQKKNIDVIVIDHHQSDLILPKAHAIVNPNRFDDNSSLNYLCAAGVAFMFLVALNKKMRILNWFKKNKIEEPNMLDFLDLVCLGTICDVVPLVNLNRAIVSQGLKVIKKRTNLGLKTLYDLCNIQSEPKPYHVGFLLGPRINAGGRVGKSSYGAELLTSKNPEEAYRIANELSNYNKQRQDIEKKMLNNIMGLAEKRKQDPVIILDGKDWHEGVIGIIASRIKDKFNKPTFIISINGQNGKGSARSVNGFNIGTAIIKAVQSGILEKGGGHKMAGGFSLNINKIDEFKNFLFKQFEKTNLAKDSNNFLYFDAILAPSAVNEDFFQNIEILSPFGSGNSEPIFVLEDVKIIKSTLLSDKHFKVLMISKNGDAIEGISFNSQGGILEGYLSQKYKKKINVVGKITLNEWQGKKKLQFVILDISI